MPKINQDAASSSHVQPATILANALNTLKILIPELPSDTISADEQQSIRNIITFSRNLPPEDSRRPRYALARWYAWSALLRSDWESSINTANDPKNKEYRPDRKRDAEEVWAFLEKFATNPPPSWQQLYQVFSNCLFEYVNDPIYTARDYIENMQEKGESESLWRQCLLQYNQTEVRYRNVRQLQDRLRTMTGIPSAALIDAQCDVSLSEAEKLIRFVSDALLFHAWLTPPDTLLAFLDRPPTEDPCIIAMGYARLILALRNNPALLADEAMRERVQAWIQRPAHMPLLAQTLDRMLDSVGKLSVSADRNLAPDARHIDHAQICNQVVLFFYRMFSGSADPKHVALSEQLAFRAWRYHRIGMMLANTGDNEYVNDENVQWYRGNQQHFFTDYAVIADTWTGILQSVAREESPQGESEQRAWLRKNLFENLNLTMTIEYNSILYGLYQNRQLPPTAATERLQALLDTMRTLPEAEQYASFLGAFQEKINALTHLHDTLPPPHTETALLHALWTSEQSLLNTLAQPMSRSCTPAQQAALQESLALYAALEERLQNGERLLDVADLIVQSLPALIANLSSSTLEHRTRALECLENILSLCEKKEYHAGLQPSLLQNLLPLLQRHVYDAATAWNEAFAERHAERFEDLQAWLEKPDSHRVLPAPLAKQLENPGFQEHFAFQMADQWDSTDLLASGVFLLKLLPINPESDLCQTVFSRFVSRLSTQYASFALEKTTEALQVYREILSKDPNFEQHITTAPNLQKKYLLPVLLSLQEAALRLADGEITKAGESVRAAEKEYLPKMEKHLTTEQLTEARERIGRLKTDITCTRIQTFMRKPVAVSGHGALMPQPDDPRQFNNFQNAWSALSAGTIKSREEAGNIHQAWLTYFEQCSLPVVKKPIVAGWNTLFKQFCEKADKAAEQAAKQAAKRAAAATSVTPPVPSPAAAAVASTTAQKPQTVKQHPPAKVTPTRQKQKQKQKGKKPAPRQASKTVATQKAAPASTASAAASASASASSLDVVPVPNVTQAPEAAPALEIVPIPDSTPAQTFPQLPAGYRNPTFAQDTLERLEARGYQAYLVGGFVRDTLLGRPYKDIDLITNCPPDELREIFPEAWANASYPGMFNRLKINDVNERPIDIICCHASKPEGFVANLDFTINAFLITSKHELLIPLPQSVDDLRTQTVRTIEPIEDSLYTDATRIFKLVNLKNRLQQPLEAPQKEAILHTRHKLHSLKFYAFLKNFQSCFVDSSVARENLTVFLDLGLLPAFFDRPSNRELVPELRVFVENTFEAIQKGTDEDKTIDALALFSLTLMKPEAEIQEIVQQWLAETIKPSDRDKGVFRSLSRLPERIRHYAALAPISYEPAQPVTPVMPPVRYPYGHYSSMPPMAMAIPMAIPTAPSRDAPPPQAHGFRFWDTQGTRGRQPTSPPTSSPVSSSSKDDAARFDVKNEDTQARDTSNPSTSGKPFS